MILHSVNIYTDSLLFSKHPLKVFVFHFSSLLKGTQTFKVTVVLITLKQV